jgi:hypothetical protein
MQFECRIVVFRRIFILETPSSRQPDPPRIKRGASFFSQSISRGRPMSVAMRTEAANLSDAEIVEAYLTASMKPDPDRAASYMKPGTVITFTGGRTFDHPRGPTGFNAQRYRWVKKKMDRFDVCPGAGETVVYSIGTLYGQWIDGTPFEGNRYVDRFVVQDGQIVKMDVWNDSAERILVQCGIEV